MFYFSTNTIFLEIFAYKAIYKKNFGPEFFSGFGFLTTPPSMATVLHLTQWIMWIKTLKCQEKLHSLEEIMESIFAIGTIFPSKTP